MMDTPVIEAPATVVVPDNVKRNPDPMSPRTTKEEDLHSHAARQINFIWEITQALVAVTIVGANVVAAFHLSTQNALLANAFFLVIGFYFGRTNHVRGGGVKV